MDVTFRATPDLNLVTEAAVEVQRYPIRAIQLIGLILTAVFATLSAVGPDMFGISGAAVTLVPTLIVPAWFLRQAASSGARLICVDTEYTVGPAGVTTSTEHRDATTRWPFVSDVVETPELVVLRLGKGSGLVIIPVDGLDNEQREQVLQFIRSRSSNASDPH